MTVAKFELAFTRITNSLQDFDANEMTYILRIDQSRAKSVEKLPVRVLFAKSTVSKSAGKKCAVFVGGLSVTVFIVFKMCRHRVNAVSVKLSERTGNLLFTL